MLITLIVFLCFGANVYSDSLEPSNSLASSSAPKTPVRKIEELCDKEDEMAKIPCLSAIQHEQLWGGIVKYGLARSLNYLLLKEAIMLIGKEELRKALNLPPPHPFAPYNYTEPSDAELASAPTIEAYFDLKEPRRRNHSLNSFLFFEHNLSRAIELLDKHAPVIRIVSRCRFENMHSLDASGETDRQTIDRMITEFPAMLTIVDRASQRLLDYECLEK